jgi:hypothetical protein
VLKLRKLKVQLHFPYKPSLREGKRTTLPLYHKTYAIYTIEISHTSIMRGITCLSRDAILQVYNPGNYYTTPTNTEDT